MNRKKKKRDLKEIFVSHGAFPLISFFYRDKQCFYKRKTGKPFFELVKIEIKLEKVEIEYEHKGNLHLPLPPHLIAALFKFLHKIKRSSYYLTFGAAFSCPYQILIRYSILFK